MACFIFQQVKKNCLSKQSPRMASTAPTEFGKSLGEKITGPESNALEALIDEQRKNNSKKAEAEAKNLPPPPPPNTSGPSRNPYQQQPVNPASPRAPSPPREKGERSGFKFPSFNRGPKEPKEKVEKPKKPERELVQETLEALFDEWIKKGRPGALKKLAAATKNMASKAKDGAKKLKSKANNVLVGKDKDGKTRKDRKKDRIEQAAQVKDLDKAVKDALDPDREEKEKKKAKKAPKQLSRQKARRGRKRGGMYHPLIDSEEYTIIYHDDDYVYYIGGSAGVNDECQEEKANVVGAFMEIYDAEFAKQNGGKKTAKSKKESIISRAVKATKKTVVAVGKTVKNKTVAVASAAKEKAVAVGKTVKNKTIAAASAAKEKAVAVGKTVKNKSIAAASAAKEKVGRFGSFLKGKLKGAIKAASKLGRNKKIDDIILKIAQKILSHGKKSGGAGKGSVKKPPNQPSAKKQTPPPTASNKGDLSKPGAKGAEQTHSGPKDCTKDFAQFIVTKLGSEDGKKESKNTQKEGKETKAKDPKVKAPTAKAAAPKASAKRR